MSAITQHSEKIEAVSGITPKRWDVLRDAIVCPDCRSQLVQQQNSLRCERCNGDFPISDGVIRLWPPTRIAAIEKSITGFRGAKKEVRENKLLRALLPPSPVCDPCAGARHEQVKNAMRVGLVVNLGSKSAQWGEHVVNLDLVMPLGGGGNVHALADIHRLPFRDASVDGVICTYVLEHVADSRACIDEIQRVVKPGGHVYITVPFLFPTHPDPLDRWRWTLDGLRYSLGSFDEISAGPSGGPFTAMVALWPTMMASMFSNFYLFNAIRFSLGWLMWPLKFLDLIACRSKRAYMTASNFYFFGRKRAES